MITYPKFKSFLAGLLSAALMLSFSAACTRPSEESESSSSSSSISSSSSSSSSQSEPERPPYPFVNALSPQGILAPSSSIPQYDNTQAVKDAYAVNDDVRGYLYIPDTLIDEPLPQSLANNSVYLRLNWRGAYEFNGCFWLDKKSILGKREQLSDNVVIYGHNLKTYDDPNGLKFAQLYKFLDQEFSETHPYIYVSTQEDNFVYQIVGAFYTEVYAYQGDGVNLFYNNADFTPEQMALLNKEIKARSEYNYNLDIGPEDKLLTLSTCTYHFTSDIHAAEPYRFIVIAKLLPENARGKEQITLEKNPQPKAPQV